MKVVLEVIILPMKIDISYRELELMDSYRISMAVQIF